MIDMLRDMIVALAARVAALEDRFLPATPEPEPTFPADDSGPSEADIAADEVDANDPPEAA